MVAVSKEDRIVKAPLVCDYGDQVDLHDVLFDCFASVMSLSTPALLLLQSKFESTFVHVDNQLLIEYSVNKNHRSCLNLHLMQWRVVLEFSLLVVLETHMPVFLHEFFDLGSTQIDTRLFEYPQLCFFV